MNNQVHCSFVLEITLPHLFPYRHKKQRKMPRLCHNLCHAHRSFSSLYSRVHRTDASYSSMRRKFLLPLSFSDEIGCHVLVNTRCMIVQVLAPRQSLLTSANRSTGYARWRRASRAKISPGRQLAQGNSAPRAASWRRAAGKSEPAGNHGEWPCGQRSQLVS